MKRNTTPSLEVTFAIDNENLQSIEFVFKQEDKESAPALVEKTYPDDVTYKDGVYRVPFTTEETLRFEENKHFYMDTRPHTKGGAIPETPIVKLFMNKTLFKSEAVGE